MELTPKETYMLLRKRKNIKLRQLAEHLECTEALISMYERGLSGMSDERVRKYMEFIDTYGVNAN